MNFSAPYKTHTKSVAQPSGDGMMSAYYPQHINAGTYGDCATYHIKDVITSPLLKQGGESGVVLINKIPSKNQPNLCLAGNDIELFVAVGTPLTSGQASPNAERDSSSASRRTQNDSIRMN